MALLLTAVGAATVPWRSWIANLGHDTYAYPSWVDDQIASCECSAVGCFAAPSSVTVDWRAAPNLTYCVAKSWLLEHMPEFDKHFLPPSIAVNMSSMLDDHISFALMADAAAPWSASVPLAAKLAYLLPTRRPRGAAELAAAPLRRSSPRSSARPPSPTPSRP